MGLQCLAPWAMLARMSLAGRRWSKGRRYARYARYYVPVGKLRLVDPETGREPEPRRGRT